ncbi:FxLD family lantipeptide [Saccharopolyspora lacisalsi]|uniref:FxLD family lantipeptide n=1 Tax=Halosaccharopolyspora lacisalsi TaxID=1000566 RepID=A0A839DUB7_9PSEU|nr:FxLD family lanthipeptide [Halosaccharopolyspora lacisalsi]MBA8823866.1 FxLD family lantipeptide [Halosaccharopolyspora lacisalsi]
MTTAVSKEPVDVFDLDVRVTTDPIRNAGPPRQTDDGCGHTCEISACNSSH